MHPGVDRWAQLGAILNSVAAAIGQIILGFAAAQVQAAQLGALGWLAFLGAGFASIATVISTVKGFADGGIIGGNTFHGDAIVARVNAGEMILNRRQQGNLFRLLDSEVSRSDAPAQVEFVLRGDSLYGSIANHKSKMGLA